MVPGVVGIGRGVQVVVGEGEGEGVVVPEADVQAVVRGRGALAEGRIISPRHGPFGPELDGEGPPVQGQRRDVHPVIHPVEGRRVAPGALARRGVGTRHQTGQRRQRRGADRSGHGFIVTTSLAEPTCEDRDHPHNHWWRAHRSLTEVLVGGSEFDSSRLSCAPAQQILLGHRR